MHRPVPPTRNRSLPSGISTTVTGHEKRGGREGDGLQFGGASTRPWTRDYRLRCELPGPRKAIR